MTEEEKKDFKWALDYVENMASNYLDEKDEKDLKTVIEIKAKYGIN
jgi:hypothetical protein